MSTSAAPARGPPLPIAGGDPPRGRAASARVLAAHRRAGRAGEPERRCAGSRVRTRARRARSGPPWRGVRARPRRTARSRPCRRRRRGSGRSWARSAARTRRSAPALRWVPAEVDGQQREPEGAHEDRGDRCRRGGQVLLTRHQRSCRRVRDAVEGISEQEPEDDERHRSGGTRGPAPPARRPAASAAAPVTVSWATPSRPMPSTLPVSRRRGDTVVSSSSTTRDDFSSVTLTATALPNPTSAAKSARSPTDRKPWSASRFAGSSASIGSGRGASVSSACACVSPRHASG